jgi:hypothetical protein
MHSVNGDSWVQGDRESRLKKRKIRKVEIFHILAVNARAKTEIISIKHHLTQIKSHYSPILGPKVNLNLLLNPNQVPLKSQTNSHQVHQLPFSKGIDIA